MNIIYSGHAIKRMFERGISTDDVIDVLAEGIEIASYPEDQPFASRLLMAWVSGRPLHALVSESDTGPTVIITAYQPDPSLWDSTFTKRLL